MRRLALPLLVLACVSGQADFQNGDLSKWGLPEGFSALAMWPGHTNIAPWEIVRGVDGAFSGSVEYIDAWSHDRGGACVELGYYYGTNGIQQTFDTLPNREFEVTFWLATDPFNGPAASVRVSAAGSVADYVAGPGTGNQNALGWTQNRFRFTSDNSGYTTLLFESLIGIAALDSIEINPISQPPVIHSVSANPSVLWPPNHEMVPVRVAVKASDDSPASVCRIIAVTSNEAVNRRAPAWQITGPLSVNLRAERSGRGIGRIYTITVECEDEDGNRATGEVDVLVPTSPTARRSWACEFCRDQSKGID
jgi:hypothetical protein